VVVVALLLLVPLFFEAPTETYDLRFDCSHRVALFIDGMVGIVGAEWIKENAIHGWLG
jgi:hypothetical protein